MPALDQVVRSRRLLRAIAVTPFARPVRIAAAIVVALALTARVVWATSAGPQPGTTGVPARGKIPAEITCTSCHSSSPQNPDGAGRLELRGLPERYTPGTPYTLTFALTSTDPTVRGFGFQLTAVRRDTLAGAGELVATDAKTTQVLTGDDGERQYVEHTYNGLGAGKTGGNSWTFEWIAPAHDVGDVAFFAAANAANLDGSKEGDHIYSRSPEPLAIVPAPAGGAPVATHASDAKETR